MRVEKIITIVCTMTILAGSITAPAPVMYELTQPVKSPVVVVTHPELEVISPRNITRLEEISTWGKGKIYDLDVSPDKLTIAVIKLDGIHLFNSSTLEEKLFLERGYTIPGDTALTVKFTPDGSHLALSTGTFVTLYNLNTNKTDLSFLSQIPSFNVVDIQISRDNKFAILKTQGSSYQCEGGMTNYALYDLSNSAFERVYDQYLCGTFSYSRSRLTADNKAYFFYWSGESNYPWGMDVVDLSGNFPVERVKYDFNNIDPLKMFYDVSPDGQWFVSLEEYGLDKETSHIVLKTGKILESVDGEITFNEELQYGKPVWRNRDGFPDIPENTKCKIIDQTRGNLQKLISNGDLNSFLIDIPGSPKSVELWDIAHCKRVKTISGDRSSQLKFSPDGKWLAKENGEELDVHETNSGQVHFTADSGVFREPVDAYAFSKNSEYLFTGTKKYKQDIGPISEQPLETYFINVWDIESGKKVKTITSDKHYLDDIYTGNNPDIVSVTDNDLLNFYQVSSERFLSSFPVGEFVFSKTGDYIWLIRQEKEQNAWLSLNNIWTGRKIREMQLPYININGFSMNEDDSKIALLVFDQSMNKDFMVTLDAYTGTELNRFDYYKNAFDLKSQKQLFTIDTNNGFVDLWDYKSAIPLQHFYGYHTIEKVLYPGSPFYIPSDYIHLLNISPAGDYLITLSSNLRFWDIKTGNLLGEVEPNFTLPYGNSSIALSPDGRLIVLAGTDGIIRIWGVPKEVTQ